MTLLQLPPETLYQIFNHIGSSFFRSDLSRLTVCRQWSEFAYTACFRDFYVTQNILRRLLSSPYAESSLGLVKDNAETLALNLKGFEDWDSLLDSDTSDWDGAHGQAKRAEWTRKLNNDLVYFGSIIQQSRKLRIVRIQATSELHPLDRFLERRDYLCLSPICTFLSASNITSLELDLCGTRLIPHQSQDHVCPSIAALLSTLRRLRLRLRSICADVLKPPQEHQQDYTNQLRLDQVLINLSLYDESPSVTITSAAHATCCDSSMDNSGGSRFLQLKADLEEQARVLVAQMAAPKMVRILTHVPPRKEIEMRAFDALTGRYIRLREGAD
ncbi:hypothetical protein QBC40DRAFT_278086 [Triangularia verruculosa]|uniref:F-box domain-containing protein n=1 Tax=Triangularia verruculosa TaxID=2587418 RepID=A0AAN6XLS1_9PEZI|nr:hypothetical protein QBC40DRAFT_278086 [Triangularia verruculosa]